MELLVLQELQELILHLVQLHPLEEDLVEEEQPQMDQVQHQEEMVDQVEEQEDFKLELEDQVIHHQRHHHKEILDHLLELQVLQEVAEQERQEV